MLELCQSLYEWDVFGEVQIIGQIQVPYLKQLFVNFCNYILPEIMLCISLFWLPTDLPVWVKAGANWGFLSCVSNIGSFISCRLSLLVTFMQFTPIPWKKGNALSLEILPSRKEQAPNHRCQWNQVQNINSPYWDIDLMLNVAWEFGGPSLDAVSPS